MRSLLVLIDGLGDDPIAAFNGQTPFAYARHPYMDSLLSNGSMAAVSICENDIVPESCSCILRLLGVDKKDIPQNRAYLELLAHNRDISEYEMVLRCNLIAVDGEGNLAAFNGEGLTPEEMRSAAALCADILDEVEFLHLSEYRNLLVLNRQEQILNCSVKPAHESLGENVDRLLGELRQKYFLMDYFLQEARRRLAPFSRHGLHYMLYPWGPSARQQLPQFYALHHLRGGAVCKAEIVRGIAKALGMEVKVPLRATGDVDTDVAAKAEATLQLLETNDFVIAHFNGSDEAAHRYDASQKAAFISRIDAEFFSRLLRDYRQQLKIIVCGDHVTSSVSGRHGAGEVPVIAARLNAPRRDIAIRSYHDILHFLMRESD